MATVGRLMMARVAIPLLLPCVLAAVAAKGPRTQPATPPAPKVVRDLMWVWGTADHVADEGRTLATFSQASAAERAQLLGVPFVVMAGQGLPNDNAEADEQTKPVGRFPRLVWETTPDGDGLGPPFVYKSRMAQIRRLVDKYPQIEGILLDDMSTGKIDRGFRAEHIRHIREQLGPKYRSVKSWGVVYSMSFGRKWLAECIKEMDVINLWVWHAKDLVYLEKYVAALETQFAGKPIVVGLYLHDYGAQREIPLDLLETQCTTALGLARAGRIQGIVFLTIHSDVKALTWTRDWIARVGGQPLRVPAAQPPARKAAMKYKIPSNWPTFIEGTGGTILQCINAGGKVLIENSADEGVTWKRISTIEKPGANVNGNYFTRLAEKSLLLVVVEDKSISWVRSDNDGVTWSKPTLIMSREGHRHAYGPIITTTDGRWAYCPYYETTGKDGKRKFQSFLLWSRDKGKTWSKPIAFPRPADGNAGLTEGTIVELGPNNYLAAIRTDEWPANDDAFDGFYLSRSTDGLKWSTPESLCERGRMPLFYRIGGLWALAYRLYDPARATQHSAVRFSRDGDQWTDPIVIESNVNANPQLVQVKGKIIAFNNLYPNRAMGTRNVLAFPDWVRRVTGGATKEK